MWYPVLNYRPTHHEMLQFCEALSDTLVSTGTAQDGTFASHLTAFLYVTLLLVLPVPAFVECNIEVHN